MKVLAIFLFHICIRNVYSFIGNNIKKDYRIEKRSCKMYVPYGEKNAAQKLFEKRFLLNEESYSDLLNNIENHKITKLFFNNKLDSTLAFNDNPTGEIVNDFSITQINPYVADSLTTILHNNNVKTYFLESEKPSVVYDAYNQVGNFVGQIIVPFFLMGIIFSIFRSLFINFSQGGGGQAGIDKMFNSIGNSDIEVIRANYSLSSFAGSPEIFQECTEVISYLNNDTLYKNIGAEVPRGILLEGPPGTGKTLLAKAIASECNASFISIAASEFVEIFVGVGAAKIRTLFEKARENKPCIIFIDEIDAVGRQRGAGINMANDEREQTLNQLLAEMDGFTNNDKILVIAATNRKDVLDSALLRPGRFDRIIAVPLPDRESRKDILKVHMKNKMISPLVDIDLISDFTSGFSGAQLKNLLNEAAIFCVREGGSMITQENILDALEKVIVGIVKKNDDRDDNVKMRIAIHEIGHALLSALFDEYFDLKKVTIQSTYNGAGGYTIFNEYQNITDGGLYTKDILFKRLIVTMGGKAAETIYYGNDFVSVGAVQDLKQANSLAQRMIGNFGMGTELEIFFNENIDSDRNPFLGRTLGGGDKYSDDLKQKFDTEMLVLLSESYQKAKQLILKNIETMDKLIDLILEKNTLYGHEIKGFINKDL
jgi:cell division protease FtsH